MARNKEKKGGGILIGFILIIASAILLWYNEGRTVKTTAAINEVEKNYKEIKSDVIDPSNDGKLIATSGKITFNGMVNDSEFNVSISSPVLVREVEMYQWKEECETDSKNNEVCSYKKVWSSDLIDSDDFQQTRFVNPSSIPYESREIYANGIKLGAFDLGDFRNHITADIEYKDLSETTAEALDIKIDGHYYTTSEDLENVEIGDVRISFKYSNITDASILAVQTGNTFTSYRAKNGQLISNFVESIATGPEMIQQLRKSNKQLKWLLRLLGVILMIFGINLLVSPLKKLASYIPILGNIFNFATGLICTLVAIVLSLFIIAVAWLRYRPVLSIGLIVIIIGLLVLIITLNKKEKGKNNPENIKTSEMSSIQANTPIPEATTIDNSSISESSSPIENDTNIENK